MFYVRYGKAETKNSFDRVILDTVTFQNESDQKEFAKTLREFAGYWTFCFDEKENDKQIELEIECQIKKLIKSTGVKKVTFNVHYNT